MVMKIIIVVRRTIDYKAMTKDKFLKQKTWARSTLEQMSEVIDLWDKIFKIKYFDFRHQLRSIAASNWITIPKLDGIVSNANMVPNLLSGLKDNYCLLFVDDDDWFNPRITSVLEANSHLDAFNWKLQYFITSSRRVNLRSKPLFWVSHDNHYLTNNYAITKKGFEKLGKDRTDDLVERNWGHEKADEVFRLSGDFNIEHLNARSLSMTSKSMASVGEIWKVMRDSRDRKKVLIETLFAATNTFNIPTIYRWGTKYIRDVESLYTSMI